MTSPRWLGSASSLILVAVIVATWVVVSLVAPAAMDWFDPNPYGATGEGPVESIQNVLLPITIALWLVIAGRHAGTARSVLALAMALQLAFILGEEVDWGQTLGWRSLGTWRNVRMLLRDAGVLQRWDDAIFPTLYFLSFMLVPLVPLARVQRWLERMAPLRAERGDGLAVALLPPTWIAVSTLVVPQRSVELMQTCAYSVALNVAIRILRAPTRGNAPA